MGETSHRVLNISTWQSVDATDVLTVSGFVALVAGVWLEFGTGYALIVSGMGLLGLGLFAIRGGR